MVALLSRGTVSVQVPLSAIIGTYFTRSGCVATQANRQQRGSQVRVADFSLMWIASVLPTILELECISLHCGPTAGGLTVRGTRIIPRRSRSVPQHSLK
jgi:hypothetical protein